MNTKLLRNATLSLGAAAGAMLAVAFLPIGVAAADELFWYPDFSMLTQTSETTDALGLIQETGYGPLNGSISPLDPTIVDSDALQANDTITDWPGFFESGTWDVTAGDAAIPTGSVIDITDVPDAFATETIEIPNAGLFGLPEITETFFTLFGNFTI
jgi:hypothetical protein